MACRLRDLTERPTRTTLAVTAIRVEKGNPRQRDVAALRQERTVPGIDLAIDQGIDLVIDLVIGAEGMYLCLIVIQINQKFIQL